jgi:thiol-disulfide isomerase/thioredoxin
MKKFTIFFALLFSITFQPLHVIAQGYNIKIKVPGLKDSTLYLGYYFAKAGAYYPTDTLKLNKNGEGTFKRSKPLSKGFYLILLPKKKYFDLIIGSDQVFSITVDTSNLITGIKFEGSNENKVMSEYRSFLSNHSAKLNKLGELKNMSASAQQKDSLSKAMDAIHKEVLAYIAKTKKENPNLFFVKFLNAIDEIKVPDAPRDNNGRITDSAFQYKYYRAHYFDNFNIADPDLIRTMYYDQKITDYMDKIVPQMPDTLMLEVDKLLEKVKNQPELFRYELGTFYNKYASNKMMGHDGVFVHLAEKWYLPYATWSDSTFKATLKKDIAKVKPSLIGNIAPNLTVIRLPSTHFIEAKNDTALKSNPNVGFYMNTNEVKARFTILVFWEADCSHCKKALPEIYEVYKHLKNYDVKVIALHALPSIDGKRKWIDFINEHQFYDWINVWSPTTNNYRDLYNILAFPAIYILDQNKKIIGKQLGSDQIEDFIKFELNGTQNKAPKE